MDSNFNFFLPLSKIDPKTRTVSGYASTPALDLDGEIVSLDAIKKALPGYWEYRNIREMHTNSAVGIGKEANIDDKGLFLTAKIVDDEAWNKCVEGVYKGFSVGGRKLNKTGNTITEIDWIETSIVDRPANPECKFEVAKRAKDPAPAYLLKVHTPRSTEAKALSKMAQVVEILSDGIGKAGPPAARDGFSLPAKPTVAKPTLCKKHGLAACAKCAMKMWKREVKASERASLASHGNALPGGGFPIKNRGDLANARQAVGRAKNPGAARALIRRRAGELGVKLPAKWSKKLAKSLIAEAEGAFLDLAKSSSAQLPFLTLEADVEGGVWSGHEPDSELTLRKGGADDKIRKLEPNFLEDPGMSKKSNTTVVDPLEKFFADLAKAGGSPNPFARLRNARENVDKARKMRKAAEGAIKSAHGLLKAAYLAKQTAIADLAKAGKKPYDGDADDMDTMGKAMAALNKAYGSVTSMKTFMKAVDVQLKKVGQSEQSPTTGNAHLDVPAGVKNLSQNDLVTAGPGGTERGSEPPILGMEQPFPGKVAKLLKGYVSPEMAAMMAKAAAAEAKVEVLEKLPSGPVHGGRRPLAFDVTKVLGGGQANPSLEKDLFKGVDVAKIGAGNESAHTSEVGKIIGNMILGGHGKSVLDLNFHGAAGGSFN